MSARRGRLTGADVAAISISERPSGARLGVHVKPRASKTAIRGVRDGALDVAIAAPPVEGEANAELVRALADALGVPRRDVAIIAGEASRTKVVEVRGLDAGALRARLLG